MKQVTIQVPEGKFPFLIELLNNLGIKDVHENDLYIPEWQKTLIENRLKNHNSEKAVDLGLFEKIMQQKHGF